MEIPHRGARQVALPQIHVHDPNPSERFRTSSSSSSYNSTSSPSTFSIPMSIPHARDPVPPPLPPPKDLADIAGGGNGPDIAWQWGNSHSHESDWRRSVPSVPPGSSLYGSFASRKGALDERPDNSRRGSSTSTIKSMNGRENTYPRIDEGYASLSGTSIGSSK
ncbi:hypothetical protein BGZ57DRAFT_764297 [Hyaloscypha finlandica]|nr:hypothetical protein BGZ57DRAFT_764297 [Hyaloscypha finlandica]